MKLILALTALVAFSACKRPPEEGDSVPIKEIVAGVPMIDFEAIEAGFSCRVPADWGVRSDKHLAPTQGIVLTGEKGTHISILKYPDIEPQYTDARAYAETFVLLDPKGKQPEIRQEKIGERLVLRFHQERLPYPKRTGRDRPERFDFALIPVNGGFYELQHRAPSDSYETTLPVFEAVVKSFKPAAKQE